MTLTDLDLLEEKAKKATKGPWDTNHPASYNTHPGVYLVLGISPHTDDENVVVNDDEAKREDLEFIASASPPTILELIRMVRCAREALEIIYDMDPMVDGESP